MTEAQTDYRIGANGLPPIETEQVEPQVGALELKRIIEALLDGHEPEPPDVEAVQAACTEGGEFDRAAIIGEAAALLETDLVRAWELIAPLLLGTGELREGLELVDDWHELEAPPREWLIYGWLPIGRIGMFSGKGGKGKTWLLLQLAAAMATGERDWLRRAADLDNPGPMTIDTSAPVPFPVVFASWEDEGTEFKRRLLDMERAERKDGAGEAPSLFDRMREEDNRSRFTFLDMARRGPVWGVAEGGLYNERARLLAAGKIVREQCQQRGARLLILDSLGYAYGPDDSGNEGVAQFLADWDAWGRDHNCAVLLIHHPAKNAGKDDPQFRGASSWDAHARFRWELADDDREGADPKLTAKISSEKSSYAMRPEPVYLERNQDTGWAWQAAKNQAPRTKNAALCGARTAAGTPCKARGKAEFGGRCAQHQEQAHGADQVKVRGEMVDE